MAGAAWRRARTGLDPKVKDQFVSIGYEMVANTPEQFAAFQQHEYGRWKKVIETGKISID